MKNGFSVLRQWTWILALCPMLAAAQSGKVLYQNDFEKTALNQVPDEFLVLNGDFAVQQANGNKFLELPGTPLDTFGLLFGSATNSGICVSARIYGTKKGRREPSFGIGLNGPAGFKLEVSPGKNALEIFKGDVSMANVPYNWKSGSWTVFQLRARPAGDGWVIEGKAWDQSQPEPKEWTISLNEKESPHQGRPSIWGSPYSGTPIRFDDLKVTAQ